MASVGWTESQDDSPACDPLVVHVYGRSRNSSTVCLKLVPVFINPRT